MKYMLLIQYGKAPTPFTPEKWARLSEEEQRAVFAGYQAVNQTPGVSPGLRLQPAGTATTVRVDNGNVSASEGPFVNVDQALGGYLMYEADDIDAAIELASRIPAAQMGGAVEVRPVLAES